MNQDFYSLAFVTLAATSFSVLLRHRYRLLWPRPAPSDKRPSAALAELIVFSEPGYQGISREFSQSERNLFLNGGDFIARSILVMSGNWTLYSETDFQGCSLFLSEDGGPDADGSYPDPGYWGGVFPFQVKSIQPAHSSSDINPPSLLKS